MGEFFLPILVNSKV